MAWSTVRQGGKSYQRTNDIGLPFQVKKKKFVGVRITPMSYVPPSFSCPALADDGLCAIHETKPLRCRAMPFSGYRAENDQADLLIPHDDWACDVSEDAPEVYRDASIVARADYEAERDALDDQAAKIERYAKRLLDTAPKLKLNLAKAAMQPTGGHVIVNFATVLPYLKDISPFEFASAQIPVLEDFLQRTELDPNLSEYHMRYKTCLDEMQRITKQRS